MKAHHHAAAVGSDGEVLWSTRVSNGQQAIAELVNRAVKADGEVRWAENLTSAAAALPLAMLPTTGQKVVYAPGRTVNRMAGAFRGEGKTDAKDARIIAETARTRHRDLTEVHAARHLGSSAPGAATRRRGRPRRARGAVRTLSWVLAAMSSGDIFR